MREIIRSQVAAASTLSETYDGLIRACDIIYSRTSAAQIFYPSGCITSKGSEMIAKCKDELDLYTKSLRLHLGQEGFSAVDLFNKSLMDRLGYPAKVSEPDLRYFWREVFSSGRIKRVIMTPGYEVSAGARDEERTALMLGIPVDYLEGIFYCHDPKEEIILASVQLRQSAQPVKRRFNQVIVRDLLHR